MAQTIPDLIIGDTWVDVNTASGIAVGTSLDLLNKSPTWLRLAEGTAPAADSTDGLTLGNMDTSYARRIIPTGSLTIWAKSSVVGRTTKLSVQAV